MLSANKAFGFVSKYQKNATVPTGNTVFEFKAGTFKGSGTINGAGDYRFMIWADYSEPDTFRIRIWQEDEQTT